MIKEQKWVVVPVDMDKSDCDALVVFNGACGYIRGIPMTLQVQADNEGWSLPHVWTETWESLDD